MFTQQRKLQSHHPAAAPVVSKAEFWACWARLWLSPQAWASSVPMPRASGTAHASSPNTNSHSASPEGGNAKSTRDPGTPPQLPRWNTVDIFWRGHEVYNLELWAVSSLSQIFSSYCNSDEAAIVSIQRECLMCSKTLLTKTTQCAP